MIPDYQDFAREWEAAWNSHDLDRILSHYSDDVVFRSRKALIYVGVGETQGKENLRTYWRAALDAQSDLKFEVQHVFGGHKMVVLVFRNHKGQLAAETLHFRDDGLVDQASGSQEDHLLPSQYKLQVDLWVKPGMARAFATFECKALGNMANYGGVLIEQYRPEVGPTERHVLAFPSQAAFEAYKRGPEAQAVRAERDSCIERTEITELGSD
ncbi:MAG: nuclear transport factor 2 family protein [Paracoccaceae bacterium]